MKVIDDKNKQLHWYNRNIFWITSILYCLLLIFLFIPTAKAPHDIFFERAEKIRNLDFKVMGYLREWLVNLLGLYSHGSWEHVLHNCLGILLGSVYIERKYGSFNMFLIFVGLTCLCMFDGGGIGNSYIWFALWGFVIIDFIWSLFTKERNLANILFGSITLVLEYFRSGFFDTASGGIGWGIEPYQLIYNSAHYIGFIMGIFLCIVIRIIMTGRKKQS